MSVVFVWRGASAPRFFLKLNGFENLERRIKNLPAGRQVKNEKVG